MTLDSKVPGGPLADKWDRHRFEIKLVNPANKRKFTIIVVGTGLAGASAAASLAELGYNVHAFCIHDSPRRAHSIAAQGGINAAKNYQNDGDSVYRLFYDTIKGGDYRAREANVYRLAQLSVDIIDQCVAQGVPFAREYGGMLDNRSFGGAQVSRTFYARGQTGQQLLLGAYQAMMRQVHAGGVRMFPRREMLDLVVVGRQGARHHHAQPDHRRDRAARRARGGARHRRLRHGVLPLDQRRAVERHGGLARAQARRVLRESVLHADPPDVHPGERRAPVEAHAHERVAAERRPRVGAEDPRRQAAPGADPRERARLLPRAPVSELRQPGAARRRVAQRQGACATKAAAWARPGLAVYLDFADAIQRLGVETIKARYGNLFDMYKRITDEDPVQGPDAHLPRHPLHDGRALGGLQPDEQPAGPARARRGELQRPRREPPGCERAHAGPGRRLLHHPVHDRRLPRGHAAAAGLDGSRRLQGRRARRREERLDDAALDQGQPDRCATSIARSAAVLWDNAGMSRTDASLREAIAKIRTLREEFWQDVARARRADNLNPALDYAGRVADYLEFGELLALDALHRTESCGGHFREESQTPEGEALRDDEHFSYVAAWEFGGVGEPPTLHREELVWENVHPTQRSYK